MTLPIAPMVRPSTLNGVSNGKIPSTSLTEVGPKGLLEATTARAWKALCAAAKIAGWHLTYTYGGTYRSYADQERLFRSRYTMSYDETVNVLTDSRLWNGLRWYKRRGVAAAAAPGVSNHGWGLAIDAALDLDLTDGVGPDDAVGISPAIEWLKVNAPRYGFSWELQSEPWHIRYVMGDRVPAAVLDYENEQCHIEPTPYDPVNHQYADWPTRPKIPLQLGDQGLHVRYLQDVLKNEANQTGVGNTDGQFGPKTLAAVVAFQKFFSIEPDGVVGVQTWSTVDYIASN